jgi:hypothetical protein
VPDVESSVARPVHGRCLDPEAREVTSHQLVARVAGDVLHIRVALGVRVAEIHQPGGLAVEPDRVDTVRVEVTDERFVTRVPEHIHEIRRTQAIEDGSTDARWMAMLNRLAICDNTVVQALKDNSGANDDAFRDKAFCGDGVAAAIVAEISDVDELAKYGLDFSQDESESEGRRSGSPDDQSCPHRTVRRLRL